MPVQSKVWKYFDKNGKLSANCKLCGKSLRTSSNTSNMWTHLELKHGITNSCSKKDSASSSRSENSAKAADAQAEIVDDPPPKESVSVSTYKCIHELSTYRLTSLRLDMAS